MKIKLSVIVPCYNEEQRFKNSVGHYMSYLVRQKFPWELVLVNDGSKDKTEALIKAEAIKNKNITVVSYKKNQGKGYAIVCGVKAAKGEIVLFSDLDHSVPIETIETFFPYFEKGFPVVIGSRRVKGAKILVHQHPIRETLGRGFTLLVRVLIDWSICDSTCGFKAFKNSAAQKIFSKVSIYDWAFDAEVLFVCKKFNFRFAQAPVQWSDVRGSKVSLRRDILKSLGGLIKIRLNDLKGNYL